MPLKQPTVVEQRVQFAIQAEKNKLNREESFTQLCQRWKISRQTGYSWLQRWKAEGVQGLRNRSKRPLHSPQRTLPDVEQRVVEKRRKRPDWGARKLRSLLADEGLEMEKSTIHRILHRHGLVERPEHTPSQGKRFERSEPNQLWQMDFKGPLKSAGGCLPLSVLDDHSRFVLSLTALESTQAKPVRDTLVKTFQQHGLPQAMLMDHGAPWWNAQGTGWTWLSVWLMKQGIRLCFCGIRHPQTQGKVERFHRTLKRAVKTRGGPSEPADWQRWLDEFRSEYNQQRPHEALAMKPPSSRWRPSERAYDPQPPKWDYGDGGEVRCLGVGGQLFLGQKRWEVSRALAKERVRLDRLGERILVTYCSTVVREIDLASGRSTAVDRPYVLNPWLAEGSPLPL